MRRLATYNNQVLDVSRQRRQLEEVKRQLSDFSGQGYDLKSLLNQIAGLLRGLDKK